MVPTCSWQLIQTGRREVKLKDNKLLLPFTLGTVDLIRTVQLVLWSPTVASTLPLRHFTAESFGCRRECNGWGFGGKRIPSRIPHYGTHRVNKCAETPERTGYVPQHLLDPIPRAFISSGFACTPLKFVSSPSIISQVSRSYQ